MEKITIFDALPYLNVFADRMTKRGKYKKMMSGMRLYRKLKLCDGAIEAVTKTPHKLVSLCGAREEDELSL